MKLTKPHGQWEKGHGNGNREGRPWAVIGEVSARRSKGRGAPVDLVLQIGEIWWPRMCAARRSTAKLLDADWGSRRGVCRRWRGDLRPAALPSAAGEEGESGHEGGGDRQIKGRELGAVAHTGEEGESDLVIMPPAGSWPRHGGWAP